MAKILLIDDDEPIRLILRRALAHEGHEILEAASGQEAFEYLQLHPVDLIITDLYMPDMDGIELTIRIGQQAVKPAIIAMSGGGHTDKEQLLETAQRLGAARTLAKPFPLEDLVEAVRALLPRAPT